ncbi:MAG: TIGR03960 family B12-binding radical SAM protein [Planctomycetota bacterium]
MSELYPEDLLLSVRQPGQYVGGEVNAIVKDHRDVRLTIALCYPDTYSVGMSHLGLQILYAIWNERADVAAERCFAPRADMEEELRRRGSPLRSLETHTPLHEFDVLAVSLQHEMTYTNLLAVLDLGGVPLLASERGDDDPLVIAGGPGALAPEPLADFVDVFAVGDGEPVAGPLADALIATADLDRQERLAAIARGVDHVYVPALYGVRYGRDGRLLAIETNRPGVPPKVRAAVAEDLNEAPYPTRPIVPLVGTVHDRVSLEIMRGCTRGCRFCHAGMTKRPLRWRTTETLLAHAREAIASTGYAEIGLTSLSSSDHPELGRLLAAFSDEFTPQNVSVNVPSLRVNEQLRELPKMLKHVRKSGLTIAPEAANESVRRSANKMIADDDLFAGVRAAYEHGWQRIKLYFMIGLPGDSDEHARRIPELAYELSQLRKETGKSPAKVVVSVASFVPKPHTPFQWEPMAAPDVLRRRQEIIKHATRSRRIRLRFHDVERSTIEAIFARGDRRLGKVLLAAWRHGARMDAWGESLNTEAWRRAFDEADFDPVEEFALRARDPDELLPWSMIDVGVRREYLLKERERARAQEWTADCRQAGCLGCGACRMAECEAG